MKERFLKVLKIFLMVLGGIFLIQLLLLIGAIAGIIGFAKADFNFMDLDMDENKNLKPVMPIIEYVENYRKENGIYPKNIEKVKMKKNLNLYYNYETSDNDNCYTITIKSKNDKAIKKYQNCAVDSENSSSKSRSYVEYIDESK